MRRILYIIDKPNLYGSELHLLELIKYYKSSCSVRVIAFSDGPLLKLIYLLGVQVDIVPLSWFPSISKLKIICDIIKNISPTIIHSHQPKATFWGSLLGFYLKKQRISTIHSSASDTSRLRKNPFSKILVLLFHNFIQFVSELFSNRVIFVSYASRKNSFLKYKSIVIYNWLESIPISTIKFPEQNEKIRLLSLGSLSIAKGTDLLLDFCKKLDSKVYKVSIVGDGETSFVESIRKKFEELELEVEFFGFRNDKDTFFKESHIFISLSRSETFGLAFAEAASFGLPIFARNLEVLHEILPNCNYLNDNNDVLVFNLEKLVKDKQLFESINSTNHEWTKAKFEFSKNIRVLTDLYDNLNYK